MIPAPNVMFKAGFVINKNLAARIGPIIGEWLRCISSSINRGRDAAHWQWSMDGPSANDRMKSIANTFSPMGCPFFW